MGVPNGCLERHCSPASGTRTSDGWKRSGGRLLFITTVTIIPLVSDGWASSAGWLPVTVGNVAFLIEGVVLLVVTFYLLKQGLARVTPAAEIA